MTKCELGFDLELGFGYEHQEGSMWGHWFYFIFWKNMIKERLIICYPWSWIIDTSLWLVFSFICNEQGEGHDKLKIKILQV